MSDDFDDDDFPEMDLGDVDGTKIGSTIHVDRPGKYHFEITEVRPRLQRNTDNGHPRRPDILVVCSVLESVPGQSGKGAIYYHSLVIDGKGGGGMEEWAREAFSNFLCGLGVLVLKDGKVIDPTTGTTAVHLKTLSQRIRDVGQFIGEIKVNKSDDPKYSDKYELIFGRGVFQVDDPAVSGVPKNAAALKLIGKESAAAGATAGTSEADPKSQAKGTGKKNGNAAPAAVAPAAPVAAHAAVDMDDL